MPCALQWKSANRLARCRRMLRCALVGPGPVLMGPVSQGVWGHREGPLMALFDCFGGALGWVLFQHAWPYGKALPGLVSVRLVWPPVCFSGSMDETFCMNLFFHSGAPRSALGQPVRVRRSRAPETNCLCHPVGVLWRGNSAGAAGCISVRSLVLSLEFLTGYELNCTCLQGMREEPEGLSCQCIMHVCCSNLLRPSPH